MLRKYLLIVLIGLVLSCSSDSVSPEQNPMPHNDESTDDMTDPPVDVGIPELQTFEIEDIQLAYVLVNGTVTNDGTSSVTERGFVVGLEQGPTIETNLNRLPVPEESPDNFFLFISDIPASTDYFVRSYAINSSGVGYGNEVTFRSLDESVFEGNVMLTSQPEVETFGQMGYTTILGELTISGTVNDLRPLSNLSLVSSKVEIINTTDLQNLDGLNNLGITGYLFANGFRLQSNSSLETLQGLTNLLSTGGGFQLINNDKLIDLRGLDSFRSVDGQTAEFRIEGCENLVSLSGIEDFVFAPFDLLLRDNPALMDISSLSNLSTLGGRLIIRSCSSLTNLIGFEGISELQGLEIVNNDMLTSLDGLENLVESRDIIKIEFNDMLNDLSGLGGISTTEDIVITENAILTDLKGFASITSVSGLSVERNPKLTSLAGVETLIEANGITIRGNDVLESLNGLQGLSMITNKFGNSALQVVLNPALQSMDGLENLTFVDGNLTISLNEGLTDFCGLKTLFENNGVKKEINISLNQENPTVEEILNSCE